MEHDGFYKTDDGFLLCGLIAIDGRSLRVDGRDPNELIIIRKSDLRFEDCGGGLREYSRLLLHGKYLR